MASAASSETLALIRQLEDAVNRRDSAAFMALVTDDIVWESTQPPDGERYAGRAAVQTAIEQFLQGAPTIHFESEEVIAFDDRAVSRWRYRWTDASGKDGHVRGVDVFQVRDGKVAEILSYVKG
jgi:ketosteroid isomerase-like protein